MGTSLVRRIARSYRSCRIRRQSPRYGQWGTPGRGCHGATARSGSILCAGPASASHDGPVRRAVARDSRRRVVSPIRTAARSGRRRRGRTAGVALSGAGSHRHSPVCRTGLNRHGAGAAVHVSLAALTRGRRLFKLGQLTGRLGPDGPTWTTGRAGPHGCRAQSGLQTSKPLE